MSSNPLRLQLLLKRYLSGAIAAGELKEFWVLLGELADNDTVEDDLKELMKQLQNDPSVQATDPMRFRPIVERIFRNAEGAPVHTFPSVPRRRYRWWWPLTGAAIVAAIWWGMAIWKPAPVEYRVAAQEQTGHRHMELPDGSIVTVNLGSSLQYPPVFSDTSREVYLSGEAFFDVVSDPAKPFLVHTGKLTVRVLGTKFNVQAYAGNDQVAVTVTEGKVQVSEGNRPLALLEANDQLTVSRKEGSTTQRQVAPEKVLSWKEADLVFEKKSLGEAIAVLEKKFGVSILLQDESLANCVFTGTYISREGLDQIIDIITAVLGKEWEKTDEHTYRILGKGCP